MGALAALARTLCAILMMMGTRLTAKMLTVAHNRMLTELAVAFRTVTGFIGHKGRLQL
jgi:hypothetical protein